MRNGLVALAFRFLRSRRLRTGLSMLAVALGTGLLAALLTLNATMDRALDEQIARNFGTYDLMAGYHEPGKTLSPDDEATIRSLPEVDDAAGVLIPQLDSLSKGRNVGLLYYGVPDTPLGRQFMSPKEGRYPGPGEVLISEAWAKVRGLTVGDMAELPMAGESLARVRISGLLPSLKTNGTQVIFDRQWMAETLGQHGATFVLLDLPDGTPESHVINSLQELFPEMTIYDRAFLKDVRANLDALRPVAYGLGIASLLASAFLLTSAFRMALAERTRELAILRAIAATPAQIGRMILAEGLLVGLTGSLAGTLLGALGASLAAGGVAALLDVEPSAPAIPWLALGLLALAGILLALLSARNVAKAAGQTDPLRAIRPDLPSEERGARQGGRFGLALILLGAIAVAAVPFTEEDGLQALLGSTGALAIAIGLLLATQRLLPLLLPAIALPFRRSPEGAMAVRSILRDRRRSGLTVGAMGLGLILVIAISTLMGTISRNMQEEIRQRHPADIQVSLPGIIHQGMSPQIVDDLRQLDSITLVGATYDPAYITLVDYDFADADPAWLAEMEKREQERRRPAPYRDRDLIGVSGADVQALVEMKAYTLLEGSVENLGPHDLVVQQDFAQWLGFRLGETVKLNLQTDFSKIQSEPIIREYRVAAIVDSYHYALPRVMMTEPLPGRRSSSVRLIFATADPARLEEARAATRALVAQPPYSMAEYSDAESALVEMQAQLYQRYALVGAVGLVMAAVAVMSLINAMVNTINERKREFALLRSVGATPRQVGRTILLESAFLGAVGGLVGTAGGVILGAGALYGLEPDHFDKVSLPWPVVALSLALSLVLAALAAIGPARRVMNVAPAEAVRME